MQVDKGCQNFELSRPGPERPAMYVMCRQEFLHRNGHLFENSSLYEDKRNPLLVENSSVVYEELREKLYQVDGENCQSEPKINSYSKTRSFAPMSKIPLS